MLEQAPIAFVSLAGEQAPELAPAVLALPLAAFVVIVSLGGFMPKRGAFAGILGAAGSLVVSAVVALDLLAGGGPYRESLYTVAASGPPTAPEFGVGLLLDPLSVFVAVLVSFVSLVVHVFSVGFMNGQGETGLRRYYAGLSLFTFAMLAFVLSDTLVMAFVFFEVVGLCSYLLIGFWFREAGPARAASKAFLLTRIGDYVLFVGVVAVIATFGTSAVAGEASFVAAAERALDPARAGELTTYLGLGEQAWVTVLALLILGGALGKSAQFPLQTWLPDAMAGPTPVSPCGSPGRRSPTMVAAGVYLIARVYGLFALSPTALAIVAVLGGLTAVGAAAVALVKRDLKQVLAYSTISQYGYMLLALGAGGYAAAVFHLTTHAVFKSLLFLGAGAIIVATDHVQDLGKLGDLAPRLRVTFGTFLIGALALAGIAPFAGFWSKDAVLLAALDRGLAGEPAILVAGGLGLAAVVLTAAYAARMVVLAFGGQARSDAAREASPVGSSMQLAMVALAVPAAVAGTLNAAPLEPILGEAAVGLERWLDGTTIDAGFDQTVSAYEATLAAEYGAGYGAAGIPPLVSSGLALALALGGGFLGWYRYRDTDLEASVRFPTATRLLDRGYYQDALQERLVAGIVVPLAAAVDALDRGIVDGLVNAVGAGSLAAGDRVGRFQSGLVSTYVLVVVAALTLLALAVGLLGGWLP